MTITTVELNPGAGGAKSLHETVDVVAGAPAPAGAVAQITKMAFGGDSVATPVSSATPMPVDIMGEAIEAIEAMRMSLQALNRTIGLMQPDAAARMRVAIDAISANLTLATITTVGTVTTLTTLTNQSQIGGIAATEQIPSLMRLAADSLRRSINAT